MTEEQTPIDEKALDSLSVAPPDPDEHGQIRPPAQDAGRDESIAKRLERDPENKEARLDRGLDESMDASDPPASTQPIHNHGPAASSGYDPEEEARLKDQKDQQG